MIYFYTFWNQYFWEFRKFLDFYFPSQDLPSFIPSLLPPSLSPFLSFLRRMLTIE